MRNSPPARSLKSLRGRGPNDVDHFSSHRRLCNVRRRANRGAAQRKGCRRAERCCRPTSARAARSGSVGRSLSGRRRRLPSSGGRRSAQSRDRRDAHGSRRYHVDHSRTALRNVSNAESLHLPPAADHCRAGRLGDVLPRGVGENGVGRAGRAMARVATGRARQFDADRRCRSAQRRRRRAPPGYASLPFDRRPRTRRRLPRPHRRHGVRRRRLRRPKKHRAGHHLVAGGSAMSLEQALQALWAADPMLPSLVPSARVFTGTAPPDFAAPTAVIERRTARPLVSTSSGTRVERIECAWRIHAPSYDEAAAISAAVLACFERRSFSCDEGEVVLFRGLEEGRNLPRPGRPEFTLLFEATLVRS
ncbi:MAG: hypothetical protein C0483_20520 [Pirellula sp.]|nr:hypothetical protein [Pirellula sp.]